MAESYKITYFDMRGRAENARMMLTMAGQEFEDKRIGFDEWPALKSTTPLGFLPTLETESGTLTETAAINMFLATKFGFLPESDFERAQVITISMALNELSTSISSKIYMSIVYKKAPVPEDLEERMEKARLEINRILTFVECLAKPGAKYIFGDKMTISDFGLYITIDFLSKRFPETKTRSQWMESFLSNMNSDEKFADYIKNRKPTTMI